MIRCLCLLLFYFPLHAEVYPQPLLPLSQEIPIEIDHQNLQAMLKNQQSEQALRDQELIKAKAFPWNIVMQLFGAFLILLIAKSKARFKIEAKERQGQKALEARINARKQIEKLMFNLKEKPVAEAYTDLSEIMRQFIEERYQIRSLTATTPEFFEEIKKHPIFDQGTQKFLKQFMMEADLVKFSVHSPDQKTFQKALQNVRYFLNS